MRWAVLDTQKVKWWCRHLLPSATSWEGSKFWSGFRRCLNSFKALLLPKETKSCPTSHMHFTVLFLVWQQQGLSSWELLLTFSAGTKREGKITFSKNEVLCSHETTSLDCSRLMIPVYVRKYLPLLDMDHSSSNLTLRFLKMSSLINSHVKMVRNILLRILSQFVTKFFLFHLT